jgi:diguanylate cyclase (GGDEF)-like protein
MITCSHPKSFSLPYLRRRGCEILAERLTLQLAALSEQRRLSDQLQKQRLRNDLTRQMDAADNIAEALVAGDVTVLDFLAADGASVRVDSRHASAGTTPTHEAVEAMVALWRSTTKENILTSAAFSTDRPDLAALVPGMEGIVLVDLGAEGDYLAWFRPEVLTTVNWMGDPAPTNRDTPLSPRNSFRMWSQSVAGQSVAWGPVTEAEAGELGRDIDTVLLRRVQARLAHQGLHDELTGLPNRRMLTRRLFQVLARRADGVPASLLFIDLDHFKFVNDTHGHDVGDALIVEAAGRISGSTRKTDMICRFGGDEFLVLCEDTDASTAEGVAERIVAAFREPVSVDGLELHITVSVGITTAKEHHQPADLIREADTAMYLSKNEGRNRSSWFTGDLLDQARNYLNTTSGA